MARDNPPSSLLAVFMAAYKFAGFEA